jgi:exopolyphosphatase/guanosine-5'-triphosphate,3'-diphosphate pyrophosphatase
MDALSQESLALRARYDEEPSHSDQVAKLALQIFDSLQSWHRMGARSRELLLSAALLHDIGWSQTPDGKGHHKWSARMIREYPWKHLSRDEVTIVAQIARYHRKSPPAPEHDEFQALKSAAQKTVMILGGILRIADALDRTHSGRIARAEASVLPECITVRVEPTGTWEAEHAMFDNKRDMLQMIAERPTVCVSHDKS